MSLNSNTDSNTNAFYEIDNEKLTILGSDGDVSKLPEPFHREEEDGRIDIFQLAEGKQLKEWKMKIGTLLAQELGVVTKGSRRRFILTEFPSGYRLYVHKRGTKADHRQDNYLHGSRYVSKFRSPNEFILHAHWLCIGAPLFPSPVNKPLCQCKYCTGNEKAFIESFDANVDIAGDADEGDNDVDVDMDDEPSNSKKSKTKANKKKKSPTSKSMSKSKSSILGTPSSPNVRKKILKSKAKAKENLRSRKEKFSQSEVSRLLMGKKAISRDEMDLKERERMKKEAAGAGEEGTETVRREHKGVGGAIWTSRK